MFENGLAPVWNTKLDEFGIMGAGVPLYFRLLVRGACDVARGVCWPSPGHLDVLQKYLASSFLIMTVLSAPIWFFSAVGSGLDEVDTSDDAIGWSMLTIGNARTGEVEDPFAPVNATYGLSVFGGGMTGKEVSYAIMVSDLVMAIFFIGVIFFARHKFGRVIQETDANNVTTGDYSVMVQGLPDDATQFSCSSSKSNSTLPWPTAIAGDTPTPPASASAAACASSSLILATISRIALRLSVSEGGGGGSAARGSPVVGWAPAWAPDGASLDSPMPFSAPASAGASPSSTWKWALYRARTIGDTSRGRMDFCASRRVGWWLVGQRGQRSRVTTRTLSGTEAPSANSAINSDNTASSRSAWHATCKGSSPS